MLISGLRGQKVNLAQIRVLLAVVEHGSVTSAANHLNVTQPAVTKRIRELERALGVPLVERSGRGIVPTRFGDAFVRHGRAALAEIVRASDMMTQLRDAAEAAIQVGTLPSAAYGLVPVAVTRLLDESPHASISIVEGTLDPLISALRQGKLDMVVGALPEEDAGQDLAFDTLFYDWLHVAVRRGHPFVKRKGLTLRELRSECWILPPRDVRAHRQWRNAFVLAGMEPPRQYVETASLAVARALLLSSNRIALMPRQVIEFEKQLGLLRALAVELPTTRRAIGITTRSRSALPEIVCRLIMNIHDAANQYAVENERNGAHHDSAEPTKRRSRLASTPHK
jgi:DNA-binding transcriptional LysR family regulator